MEKQQIDIYISDNCAESNQLIDFLQQKNVDFSIKNTSKNKDYLHELQQKNIYITPTVILDNYYSVLGFQQDKISEMLSM